MNTKIKLAVLDINLKIISGLLKLVGLVQTKSTKFRTYLYQKKSMTQSKKAASIPVTWKYDNNSTSVGFIAQTVQSVIPSAITASQLQWSNTSVQLRQPVRNSIVFNSSDNNAILTITGAGDVIWSGKPSEAAAVMVRSFTFTVEDELGISKAARRRYYYLACRNLLSKAKKMDGKELIDHLEKEVYNREGKVMWDALTNEHKN
jgi:hypothetical protein